MIEQWSAEHERGMIEAYQEARERKAVMPYAEPVAPVPTQKQGLGDVTALIVRVAPPVLALTALGSVVCVVVAMAAAAIGAGFAFISANLAWVGGAVVTVAVGVLAWAGRASGGDMAEKAGNASTPQNIQVTVNVAGQTVTTTTK